MSTKVKRVSTQEECDDFNQVNLLLRGLCFYRLPDQRIDEQKMIRQRLELRAALEKVGL